VVVVVDELGGVPGTTTVAGAGWTMSYGGVVRSSVQEMQPLAMTQTPSAISNVKARRLIENNDRLSAGKVPLARVQRVLPRTGSNAGEEHVVPGYGPK
jgi:hypothetical protein